VDRVLLVELDLAAAVHRVAGDVEDAAEDAVAHRDGDGGAGVDDLHAALEALDRGHRDRAGDAGAEVLLDLEREVLLLPETVKSTVSAW
jgi:hypothetical protein